MYKFLIFVSTSMETPLIDAIQCLQPLMEIFWKFHFHQPITFFFFWIKQTSVLLILSEFTYNFYNSSSMLKCSMLTTYTLPARKIWFNLVIHLSLLLSFISVTLITKYMPSTTHHRWKCWRDDNSFTWNLFMNRIFIVNIS